MLTGVGDPMPWGEDSFDTRPGTLDPSTLYLLWSSDAKFDWAIGPDDGVGVFDGYFVVAPGWFAQPRGSIAPEYLVRGPMRGIAP